MSPRISYVQPAAITDPAMLAELDRCRREGTPRPESQAIRAHVPATFWSFANTWRDVFHNGVADHSIKELCRIYVSRSVLCEFCGNQRSIKAAKAGVVEDDYRELINFESSTRYSDKQKAALSYAEAITWDLPTDDAFWARLHKHFSEPELVEIGYFVAITMGQQRWLRTLNIEHHQILAGTDASMAPGFETEQALKELQVRSELLGQEAGQAGERGGGVTSPLAGVDSARRASPRATRVWSADQFERDADHRHDQHREDRRDHGERGLDQGPPARRCRYCGGIHHIRFDDRRQCRRLERHGSPPEHWCERPHPPDSQCHPEKLTTGNDCGHRAATRLKHGDGSMLERVLSQNRVHLRDMLYGAGNSAVVCPLSR